ncbi:hypothetical protein BpHYR1_016043 [Brachionus plicatilis]|uniref:Uncharacterized protein n=1 Tax=Brachionus plicatilis TaxID=10195 RepID=A0A3M7R4V5_BRAPC|nr:hypothetical protein BpHYR1_016043 [Brachionus plicatilis]
MNIVFLYERMVCNLGGLVLKKNILASIKYLIDRISIKLFLKFARSGFISKNLYSLGLSNANTFAIYQNFHRHHVI